MAIRKFIKWVGSKQDLIPALLSRVPIDKKYYISPFVGGGSLFWALSKGTNLKNHSFIDYYLSDSNFSLVNYYEVCRDHYEALLTALQGYKAEYDSYTSEDQAKAYATIKKLFNEDLSLFDLGSRDIMLYKRQVFCERDLVDHAVKFYILNRLGFSGLFRTNSKGEFNTPFGKYRYLAIPTFKQLTEYQYSLKNVCIYYMDFREVCNWSSSVYANQKFFYFDPPYLDCSTKYTANGWNPKDLEDLKDICDDFTSKGISFMLSHKQNEFVNTLFKDYKVEIVKTRESIQTTKTQSRVEMIVTNQNLI